MMWLTRKRSAYLGAALAAAALLAYAFRPSQTPVETSRVSRGPLRVTVDEDGETRVRDRYVVTTPVDGRVRRIVLDEGDTVAAGGVVALIDPGVLDARGREQATARLRQLEDARREAETRVIQARTEMEQATRDRERTAQLVAAGALAQRDGELADLNVRARDAELTAATLRVQALEHEVEGARAALIEAGRGGTEPVRVHSPVHGRVLRILSRDERVAPAGTPLLEVGDPAAIEVATELLSAEAVAVQPGAQVLVEGWGGAQPIEAHVRRVEASAFTKVSALGVEEQRVEVIISLLNPPPTLGARYRVRVRVVTWQAADAVKVPVSALVRDGAGWYVFVVRDGRARRQGIELGHRSDREAEVRGGLAEGETVVRYPSDRIADGTRVRAD